MYAYSFINLLLKVIFMRKQLTAEQISRFMNGRNIQRVHKQTGVPTTFLSQITRGITPTMGNRPRNMQALSDYIYLEFDKLGEIIGRGTR